MDVDRVIALARKLALGSTPFLSAWELGCRIDGEDLHSDLREALGISYEEWRDSDER